METRVSMHDFRRHRLAADPFSDSEWAYALFLSKVKRDPFMVVPADMMSCPASES
jgi:hypothetical protein